LLHEQPNDDRGPKNTASEHTTSSVARHMSRQAYHGTCERCFEVAQNPSWKRNRPRTLMARSP
jgi:hypothetical protein